MGIICLSTDTTSSMPALALKFLFSMFISLLTYTACHSQPHLWLAAGDCCRRGGGH
jgi:hypothetical protein